MSAVRVHKTFTYRLYPTHGQTIRLTQMLADHCELYNAALQERRDAYRHRSKTMVWQRDQQGQLKAIRESRPDQAVWSFTSQQQTLRRLDKAFAAFFRRVRSGATPGYPRFRPVTRFDSVDFRHLDGIKLDWSRSSKGHATLYVKGVGTMKVRMHRPLPEGAKLGEMTVRRDGRRWFVMMPVEMDANPLPATGRAIGGDLGVKHLLTLSEPVDGLTDAEGHIEHPRYWRKAQERLAAGHREMANRRRGSNRYRKSARRVGEMHRRVRRARRDTAHKVARRLVDAADVLVFEDLATEFFLSRPKPKPDPERAGHFLPNGAANKAGLIRSVTDAGWQQLITLTQAKAADAGRTVILVNPAYTSRTCSGCGHLVKSMTIKDRVHVCPACGQIMDRDVNAAKNILRAGTALRQASA